MHIGGHEIVTFAQHKALDVVSGFAYVELIPRELPSRARGLSPDGTYTVIGAYQYRIGDALVSAEVKMGDYSRIVGA